MRRPLPSVSTSASNRSRAGSKALATSTARAQPARVSIIAEIRRRSARGRAMRLLDRPGNRIVMRRQCANRVGVSGVAAQQIRLAAAAAEILEALGTRTARLLHPVEAAKRIERLRLVPD